MSRSDDRGLSNSPNTDGSGPGAEIIESDESPGLDTEHVPAPAPHVDGEPPRAYELFERFQINAGGDAWLSAKHPVDVEGVR